MAHGYLSYQAVTGESPLADKLFKKIGDVVKKEGKKTAKKVLSGVKDLLKKDKDTTYRGLGSGRVEVTGKKQGPGGGMLSGTEPKGLLAAGKGGLVKREDREAALGKNPSNIDRREQKVLGPAGSSGRARKGGGPVDMGGAVSQGLNKDSFFQARTAGIDSATGEYLSKEDRISLFKKGMALDNASSTSAPPLDPDNGIDIVAAVNRNTQAILNLVDVTKLQTQSDVNIAQQAVQTQETMFSRRTAKKEEQALEEGEDLSSFVTPEKIMKAVKPKAQGGGGGDDKKGGGFGFPGLGGLAKGLKGVGGKALLYGGAIIAGLAGGISLGTHLKHQYLDGEDAKQPKRDRLGNLLDDDGNVISGPSAPGPGFNEGGLVMSMNALAGSTNTPSSGGGYAEGGMVGMSSQSRKMYKAFGQGIVDAQIDEKKKLAEITGEGLKNYFEVKGGFDKLATFLGGVGDFFKNLGGNILNSILGGAANAAGGGGMVDPTISGDEEEYLMRLMIAEAGGEGELGMAAVGRSVLNRAGLIQSGEVGAGTFMSKSGSITDVIEGSGQYQPFAEGKLKRALTEKERARAKKALAMARNQASLRGNLEASGMNAANINKIMASTGFRTHAARYDASQEVNVTELGGHRFNTAGNAKMLTPNANVSAGVSSKEGTGMSTFGETDGGSGRLVNAAGYVHGHFQSDTGTAQDVVNDTSAVVRSMLNSGLTDISISDGTTFLPSMSDSEIKGVVEKGLAQHSHSGDGRSVDIFVPKGTPVPFPLMDVSNSGNGAGRTGILPGSGNTWVGHLTPDSQSGSKPSAGIAAEPDTSPAKVFASAKMPALAASSASPQTGTPLMASSQQVAMATSTSAGGAPTIINNYYGSGGGQDGTPVPNGVSPGIGMDNTGLASFQDLKIRSLA